MVRTAPASSSPTRCAMRFKSSITCRIAPQDFRRLNRVYLPLDWMAEEQADLDMLARSAAPPPLIRVIRRTVASCRGLMQDARALPSVLRSRQLAMESAVIIQIADRLLNALDSRDPIAERVELTRLQFAGCAIRGAAAGLFR